MPHFQKKKKAGPDEGTIDKVPPLLKKGNVRRTSFKEGRDLSKAEDSRK